VRNRQDNDDAKPPCTCNNQTPAHAHSAAGDTSRAREYIDRAVAAADDIAEEDDCDLAVAGLETIPGRPYRARLSAWPGPPGTDAPSCAGMER
jgi:hypothetical protein